MVKNNLFYRGFFSKGDVLAVKEEEGKNFSSMDWKAVPVGYAVVFCRHKGDPASFEVIAVRDDFSFNNQKETPADLIFMIKTFSGFFRKLKSSREVVRSSYKCSSRPLLCAIF